MKHYQENGIIYFEDEEGKEIAHAGYIPEGFSVHIKRFEMELPGDTDTIIMIETDCNRWYDGHLHGKYEETRTTYYNPFGEGSLFKIDLEKRGFDYVYEQIFQINEILMGEY